MPETTQADRARSFGALHQGPAPLRLVNAWDALSARTFALAGAPAIATSSFAVAHAQGYPDGQRIPWELVLRTVGEIVDAAGDVPVSADIEGGQGDEPEEVRDAVADVLAVGAVGINLEDRRTDEPGALFEIGAQAERISAARAAGTAAGVPLFINARSDVFFGAAIAPEQRLRSVLDRGNAYVDAGADGVFLPGLVELDVWREVAAVITVPLNAMLWPGLPPLDELAAAGVRRLSQGASAFLVAVGHLERSTRAYLDGPPHEFGGDIPPAFHLLGDLAHRSS